MPLVVRANGTAKGRRSGGQPFRTITKDIEPQSASVSTNGLLTNPIQQIRAVDMRSFPSSSIVLYTAKTAGRQYYNRKPGVDMVARLKPVAPTAIQLITVCPIAQALHCIFGTGSTTAENPAR